MAGCLDHTSGETADAHCIVLAHGCIHQRNTPRFTRGSDHAAAMAALELGNAAGVIGVMMRDENIGEPPARRLDCRFDRRGLRRVDRGGAAGFCIVQQDAIVVLETEEQASLCGHKTHSVVTWGRQRGSPLVPETSLTCSGACRSSAFLNWDARTVPPAGAYRLGRSMLG